MVQAKEQTQTQRSTCPVQTMYSPRERETAAAQGSDIFLVNSHSHIWTDSPPPCPGTTRKASESLRTHPCSGCRVLPPPWTSHAHFFPAPTPSLWRPHYISEISSRIKILNLMQTCTPILRRLKTEDHKVKTCQGYRMSLRSTWTT